MFRVLTLFALVVLIVIVSYRFIIVPIYRYLRKDEKQFKKGISKVDDEINICQELDANQKAVNENHNRNIDNIKNKMNKKYESSIRTR